MVPHTILCGWLPGWARQSFSRTYFTTANRVIWTDTFRSLADTLLSSLSLSTGRPLLPEPKRRCRHEAGELSNHCLNFRQKVKPGHLRPGCFSFGGVEVTIPESHGTSWRSLAHARRFNSKFSSRR